MKRNLSAVLAPVLALLLGVFAFSSTALAAGSARLKSSEVSEVSGAWHVFMTIELPKAPSIPHVPMKFLFTKTAVFERALVDTSKDPVTNRQNLQNQSPTVESLDVDFANGQGKIWKGTSFDFGLTRTRGYEAGEYSLQLRTSDGLDIGGKMNITLKGENPVVDRRSITFDAKKPGIKKVDDGSDPNAPPKQAKNDDTPVASQDVTAAGSTAPFIDPSAYNKTQEEEVKQHPKGCGCSVPGLPTESPLFFVGSLSGLMLLARRLKRSSAT